MPDANMYTVFEQAGRQYISIMSLTPQERVVVPLTGNTPITGNLRMVLDRDHQLVEVHYTASVDQPAPLEGEPAGLDAGTTEVFTDELGNRYGKGLGAILEKASDELCDKGRKRNKLHQLAKKAEKNGNYQKAANIRKFNLGYQKKDAHIHRQQTDMERQFNTAVNEMVEKRSPSVVIDERLDIRGKAKSKKMSRRVSLWMRSIQKERMEFKALAKGFRRQQVNPAYTSQMCSVCGDVNSKNRTGDRFQCLHCGHGDDADRVAAHNLKARMFDPEIHLYTPKGKVKEILLARFNARLERGGALLAAPTVSGRTPGARTMGPPESETSIAIGFGRENDGAKCDLARAYV